MMIIKIKVIMITTKLKMIILQRAKVITIPNNMVCARTYYTQRFLFSH